MAQEIPNFAQLKIDLSETFEMDEPDWLIVKNPEHHSAGFGIFTNQVLTVTVIHFIEVHGYNFKNVKASDKIEGGIHAHFVEADL